MNFKIFCWLFLKVILKRDSQPATRCIPLLRRLRQEDPGSEASEGGSPHLPQTECSQSLGLPPSVADMFKGRSHHELEELAIGRELIFILHLFPQAPRANECEICHEVFKSKNMRALKCGHKFHKGVRVLHRTPSRARCFLGLPPHTHHTHPGAPCA